MRKKIVKVENLFLSTLIIFYTCSIFMVVFYFVRKLMGDALHFVVH
ncbi:hypothetical protein [Flavobacterium sp. T12S277]